MAHQITVSVITETLTLFVVVYVVAGARRRWMP